MLKYLTRYSIRKIGYDLHKYRDAFQEQYSLLLNKNISTIFDVGGHYGETIGKYMHLFSEAMIYSFEPLLPSFYEVTSKYGNDAHVKPFQIAISNIKGKKDFFINHLDAASSLFDLSKIHKYYTKNVGVIDKIKVDVTTIDIFVKENNINKIDILKMDIQGGELLALKGASEQLKKKAISIIYTESYFISMYKGGTLFHEIVDFLSKYNYTLFNIYDPMYSANGQLRFCNAIFISPEIRKNVVENKIKI